ncbi:MAG: hypothetical protein K2K84_06420 [Muribaculaceae bacterium]|nr:hypothetical protein [Muribaculaceae bacterium]
MKNPLKRAVRSLSTWRHGRGFGIHSPLAYDLLTVTLREPRRTGYYAYRDLNGLGGDGRKRRLARIVFRLVSRFSPRRVAVCGTPEDLRYWKSVVALASRRATVEAWGRIDNPDMVIIAAPDPTLTMPDTERIDFYLDTADLDRLTRPRLARDPKLLPPSVHDRLGPLVINSGRGYALAVTRHGLSPMYVMARY